MFEMAFSCESYDVLLIQSVCPFWCQLQEIGDVGLTVGCVFQPELYVGAHACRRRTNSAEAVTDKCALESFT